MKKILSVLLIVGVMLNAFTVTVFAKPNYNHGNGPKPQVTSSVSTNVTFYISRWGNLMDSAGNIEGRNPYYFTPVVDTNTIKETLKSDFAIACGDGVDESDILSYLKTEPVDATTFNAIREMYGDTDTSLYTKQGKLVKWDDLTEENYEILWYVLKYQYDATVNGTNQYSWHIDGVIIDKETKGNLDIVFPDEDKDYEEFVEEVNPDVTIESATPEEPQGETVEIRIDTALKMAVRFEDGTVYYDGNMKEIDFGKEYRFQMCAVNWENGIYDDEGNGIAGSVVYTMKAVHKDEFNALRAEALNNPERYTVKGIDIIDNDAKTIIINCDASDFHLETDVNNFFVAYRFHFANGDYNKQTGIENVVNPPLESLSVNLPIGTTIKCDAYKAYEEIATENIFITENNGEGIYADAYFASVNDYTWSY